MRDDLQQSEQVRRALDRMDARCQRLLTPFFADDDERPACDEVARRLDIPVGCIGPTRARCLGTLRQLLV